MALSLLAANNAQTVLAAGISSTATSLTVNAGTGTLFPSPVAGSSFFKLTIIDAATGTLTEIIHVTARNGDVFTIQRGQEGTVPRAWSANDIVANMMTAGTLSYILGNFQPLDPTLTALAALVGVANKLPYFNGDDTAALTDLTQVGRDIIGKSTIADILTYLGIDRVEQLNNETKIYAGDDHSIFLSIRIDGLWGIYDPLHGFIPLGIEQGGTGARDAGGARTNLGLGRVEQRAGETVIYCDDKKTAYFTAREDNQWGLFDGVKFVPLGIGQGGTGAGDAAGARTNLGLGNSSTKNTGTTANTVAAGDDSRFSLMLGVGQSWQNVTANRFSGTVYTNNTGKPIQVFALWNDTPPTGWGYGVGTLTFSGPYDASGLALGFLSLVVPAGDTYFMRNTNISHWWELR